MLRELCEQAVADGVFPGGAFAVGSRDSWVEQGFFGTLTEGGPAPNRGTYYDLASLTKVLCTTTLTYLASSRGLVDLDEPVRTYLPDYAHPEVTLRHLLTHSAGLAPFLDFASLAPLPIEERRGAIRRTICSEPLRSTPGEVATYSDLGFILLGWILEEVVQLPLHEFFANQIALPYRLDLTFLPDATLQCAPTELGEPWREEPGKPIIGEVHDPTCALLGGVAGHAGLFGSLPGVVGFVQMLLSQEKFRDLLWIWGERVPPETRGLGWDTNWDHRTSAGSGWAIKTIGHTGFTGTSVFLDPTREEFGILLTNRVHPTRENVKILEFRPKFYAAAAEALRARSPRNLK